MSELKPIGELLDGSIEPPNGRLVYCMACRSPTVPVENWACGSCGRCCKFGVEKQVCDHCLQPTFAVRRGYRYSRQACRCQDTPEQRDSYRRGMLAREQRDMAENAKDSAARASRHQRETLTASAAQCLRKKTRLQGGCSYNRNNAPHECCRFCPKFRYGDRIDRTPRAAYSTPPLISPPMAEIDLDD